MEHPLDDVAIPCADLDCDTATCPRCSSSRDSTSSTSEASDDIYHEKTRSDADPHNVEIARTRSIAQSMSPFREYLFIGLLCSAQFCTQMALMAPLCTLHIIGPSLDILNPGVLAWLIAGYSLTVGTFILISGRFGDVFGYKKMVVIGYAWFGFWSVIGGFAAWGGSVLFIFSRVLAGIGPAILLPNCLGLLGATYEEGLKKNMIFSLFGACAPSGAIVGGVFAGLWSLVWWPWIFWTFGIAMFILSLLSVFILPTVPTRPEFADLSIKEKIIDLDLLGAGVGITAMILFNFAWNQAPGFGWEKPYIYVLLIVGLLMFPVFFWIEIKIAPKPLIPFDALSSDVSFVLACVACGWASFGIWIYYLFQFLQQLRHLTPLLSIAQTTPLAISGFLAALTTGHVIGRIGPGPVMFLSMLAFLIGVTLVATAPVAQTYWAQIFVCTLVIPWGMDMSFPAGTLILSSSVKKEHQGMGASLVNTVVNYSISIGVGIAGTVEVHVSGASGGRKVSEEDELRGYRGALYLAIGLSGLGVLVSSLFLIKGVLKTRRKPEVEENRDNLEA